MQEYAFVIPIVVIAVVAFVVLASLMRMYKRVKPAEMLVVYGRGKTTAGADGKVARHGFRIVSGGGTFVWPFFEATEKMSLEMMTVSVDGDDVTSSDQIDLVLDWTAQIKVGRDLSSMQTAAQVFLGMSAEDIQKKARLTLLGNVREVIAKMTALEARNNRDKFATEVKRTIADEMGAMGLEILSLTLNDVTDKAGSYFKALAQPEIERVTQAAAIAKANADRATRENKASAELAAKQAEITSQEQIALAQKNLAVKQAQFKKEAETQQADADIAKQMRATELERDLVERQNAVKLMNEEKLTIVAQKAALRREQELDGEVKKPATAKAFEIETLARADLLKAQNEATATLARAKATADGKEADLLAVAKGQEAALLAEAKGKLELAAALNAYNQAAMQITIAQAMVAQLPAMVEGFAKQFAQIGDIKIIDMGGNGGKDGNLLEKFAATGPAAFTRFVEGMNALIGVDVLGVLKNLGGAAKFEAKTETDTTKS